MAAQITISWHGIACFSIEAKHGDAVAKLVTDPFDPSQGPKLPRNLSGDVVTVSHDHTSHNNVDAVKAIGEKKLFVINTPGEYEVGGLFIYGVPAPHDDAGGKDRGLTTLFRYEIGDLSIAHLGDLGSPIVDAQREALEDVDVLMIPVGGGSTIGPKEAVEIIAQLEPRVVIPMHYNIPDLKEKRETVERFLKEIAAAKPERMTKFKFMKKDLPTEETKVVVLDIE
jgi:L-ascorbate metabolism protein UlaG (beta-lactamase superfamily)